MNGEIAIQRCSYLELLDSPQSEALLAEYAVESSIAEIGPVNPHRPTYAALESAGAMQCFIAVRSGSIVGFANVLASMVPHYSKRVATVESIFVPSACRRFGVGTALRKSMKAWAKEMDCVGTLSSAPAGGKLERVLERDRRCRKTNTVFFEGIN